MNVESRPIVVYPTFHDTQHQHKQQEQQEQQRLKKEIDIDDSIYHLLSMYLDTSVIIPPPSVQTSRVMMIKHSPYFRSKKKTLSSQQQSWLGEKKRSPIATCTELERNTMKNSYTIKVENAAHDTKTKTRSKSVSFSETVTVITLDENICSSRLLQPSDDDEEEDLFVDALENFIE